jgi:tRNA nucleotidyltransferase (CCA-adding enzyme)
MEIFQVGGSVRDELLGRPVQDRDWVVVGAHAQELVDRGFRPVGKDFPVFLHPETHEEYALARTERKTGRGYRGFVVHAAPEVTLEEDLARRDLTINAIARRADGTLVDPFGGVDDLRLGVLRHVRPAFAEDPVRILRVARFAARFGFAVAPGTLELMRAMVAGGEADHLVPERVWQEISRGLMEAKPSRMFEVLRACGALARVLPEVERLFALADADGDAGHHMMQVLDHVAAAAQPLEVRYALLLHQAERAAGPGGDPVAVARAVSERIRAPNECRDLAALAAGWLGTVHRALAQDAEALLALLTGTDAWRRPERFAQLLAVARLDVQGRPGAADVPYPQAARVLAALAAGMAVDAAALAADRNDSRAIPERIRAARLSAIAAATGVNAS